MEASFVWTALASILIVGTTATLLLDLLQQRRRSQFRTALSAMAPVLAVQAKLDVQRCRREIARAYLACTALRVQLQHLAWQREAEAAVRLADKLGTFAAHAPAPQPAVPAQRQPGVNRVTAATMTTEPSPRSSSPAGAAGDAWLAGATVAAVGAWDVVDWWRGEPALLDAIGRVTGSEITNGADMWGAIGEGGRDWTINENTVRSIRGFVGETQAAELLEGAGLSVEWPEAANQAGYDLNVQGHEVNVKVRADAESLDAHFERYPEIPVVVNEDIQGLPDNAIHLRPGEDLDPELLVGENVVIVAEGLVLTGAQDITENGLVDNAEPLDDTFEVAAPGLGALVIATRSAWREGRLAMRGDTDWLRAAKNISIDVAVRGGSSLAAAAATGLAVDAAFGGLLFGIPTIAATAAAAMGGARAGGKAAKHLREVPLREARAEARVALTDYGDAVERQQRRVLETVLVVEAAETAELRNFADLQGRAHRQDVDAACASVKRSARFDAHAVLNGCLVQLRRLCEGFDPLVIAPVSAPRSYQQRALRHASTPWSRRAHRLAATAGHGLPVDEAFWDAMAALPLGVEMLLEQLDRQTQAQAQARQDVVSRGVLRAHATRQRRHQARGRVYGERQTQIRAAQEALKPQVERLTTTHRRHLKELRAAGVNVPE
jgi:hypothetical protein